MRYGIVLAFILWFTTISADPYCEWNATYANTFYCSDLSDDSGDYVKACLKGVPLFSEISIYFDTATVDGLPSDLFTGYNVTAFACGHCTMDEFPFEAMRSFGRFVDSIHIEYSTIGNISSRLVPALPYKDHLRYLFIEYNSISAVESFAFASYSALFGLNMDSNVEIDLIEDYAFANVPNLDHLLIYLTPLNSIPVHAFYNLPLLTGLQMYGASLQTLDNTTINDVYLPNLANLYIFDNPWYCNCSLQWLKNYINFHPQIELYEDPECAEPEVGYFNDVQFCNW